ncbi:MAG: DUF4860 domain-containing protein [Erysipelotrichaceae bacterium]|nr:DUF4860 domain-containing protein [Erysipelotrichaceae bacterium]
MKQSSIVKRIPNILLMVFATLSCMLMVLSVQVYQKTALLTKANAKSRTIGLYLTNRFQQADNMESLKVMECDDSDCVLIREDDCWTYLYLDGGMLKESIQPVNTPFQKSLGDGLVEVTALHFQLVENGIQFFWLDDNQMVHTQTVMLRHRGGVTDESSE